MSRFDIESFIICVSLRAVLFLRSRSRFSATFGRLRYARVFADLGNAGRKLWSERHGVSERANCYPRPATEPPAWRSARRRYEREFFAHNESLSTKGDPTWPLEFTVKAVIERNSCLRTHLSGWGIV